MTEIDFQNQVITVKRHQIAVQFFDYILELLEVFGNIDESEMLDVALKINKSILFLDYSFEESNEADFPQFDWSF